MQTASYIDIDNWDDLDKESKFFNIRSKGTYKPLPKPICQPTSYKPCCDPNPTCPIDNQPLPVPCDLCPIKDKLEEQNTQQCSNCNNCNENNKTTYGLSTTSETLTEDVNDILNEIKEISDDKPTKHIKVKEVKRPGRPKKNK